MKDLQNSQIFDAVSIATYYGMNLQYLMYRSPAIRKQMIDLVAMIKDHDDCADTARVAMAECYEAPRT